MRRIAQGEWRRRSDALRPTTTAASSGKVPTTLVRHPTLYRQARALLDKAKAAATEILTTHRAAVFGVAQAILGQVH